jgi:uncharacterized protein YndB with AHSA1/START domain
MTGELSPITKSVTVKKAPADAFRLFTEGMASWWPLETHTCFDDEKSTCFLEGKPGGRIYERSEKTGKEIDWGKVITWQPGERVVFSFRPGHFTDGPGPWPEVEIRFTASGSGTRVDLEHRGWDRLPPGAKDVRASYHSGWDVVFVQKFAEAGNAA